jgi:hypothetical protein
MMGMASGKIMECMSDIKQLSNLAVECYQYGTRSVFGAIHAVLASLSDYWAEHSRTHMSSLGFSCRTQDPLS